MIKQIETKIKKAENLYKLGNYDNAQKICKQILRSDSTNSSALTILGNINFLQHNYEQALLYYKQIEANSSQDFINLLNLSNVYFEQNNFEQSQQYAELALKYHSDDITALSLLGNSLMAQEKLDSALNVFETLLKYKPNDCWTLNSMSQIWQKKADFQKAFDYAFSAVIHSCGDDAQQLNLGYFLYETAIEKGYDTIKEMLTLWKEKYGELPQVSYMINALENNNKIEVAEQSYLENVFDNFAGSFEQVLSGLQYTAPQYIAQYVQEFYSTLGWRKLHILDAGCGTGLCGVFLKNYASWHGLHGVDISQGMLSEARKKKLYNKLYQQELCEFLFEHKKQYDLITAADVLTYFGNLENVIKGFACALKKQGRIIFTITQNSITDSDWFLHPSGRFIHTFNYIKLIIKKYNFILEKSELKQLRLENDSPVMGYIISIRKNN